MPASSAALHARRGGVLLDLAAVGDPVAVREGGDEHARASKVSVVHGPERTRVPVRSSGGRRRDAARAPGTRPAAVGDLLARHDLGRPRGPARQPDAQPGGGAVRRRRLPDARPAPAGPPARTGGPGRAGQCRRTRARRRATASWRCNAWPPSSMPASGSSRPGRRPGRPRAPRCAGSTPSAAVPRRSKRRRPPGDDD